jgi:signal recognition particle subunit SRP54
VGSFHSPEDSQTFYTCGVCGVLQEDEVLAFQKRLQADAFDFNDFLQQFKSVNNMGGLQMLKLMPGFSGVSEKQLYEVEKKLKKYEGMITSMTQEVRKDCCLFAA